MQRIADVMTRGVEVIAPDATLQMAAKMMDDLNVGALPVCDNRRLVGMITQSDLMLELFRILQPARGKPD